MSYKFIYGVVVPDTMVFDSIAGCEKEGEKLRKLFLKAGYLPPMDNTVLNSGLTFHHIKDDDGDCFAVGISLYRDPDENSIYYDDGFRITATQDDKKRYRECLEVIAEYSELYEACLDCPRILVCLNR